MSQITKRALEQSLKNLLLQKPITKITINDIAEDCGINQRGKNQKDQIEVCEQVLLDDRGDTSGAGLYGSVDEARVLLRLHLRLSQTKLGAWR